MRTIWLTQNRFSIVDDEDYEYLKTFKWRICGQRYAARWELGNRKNRKFVLMHREILKASKAQQVDHINGDGLDNRRSNLRLCSCSQNLMNQKKTRGESRYKGVCYAPYSNKSNPWTAGVKINKKRINLGYFATEREAAIAYDKEAKKVFGRFARLNFL